MDKDNGVLPSEQVELGDDKHADRLVKPGAQAQALLVGAPVQAGDGLRRHGDVLQEADCTGHTHGRAVRVLLASLSRILTENDTVDARLRVEQKAAIGA